jgi:1,6-anhydro-N-acetylmuramate kinase
LCDGVVRHDEFVQVGLGLQRGVEPESAALFRTEVVLDFRPPAVRAGGRGVGCLEGNPRLDDEIVAEPVLVNLLAQG